MEKRDGKLVVHSLSGHERNHFFANKAGKAFTDLSALSGLDNPADSRGWALLDYDRDGWQDVALVNANEPLFNFYRNQMPAAGFKGGIVAVKFVGGNRTASPSAMSSRDGYGARLTVELGDTTLTREHRCGDGFAAQHSATMLLGIGSRPAAGKITVRWPSGKTATIENVAEGTLLTCYENAAENGGQEFASAPYRVEMKPQDKKVAEPPLSPFADADKAGAPGARLRVYTNMATWCASCLKHLPQQALLAAQLGSEVELIAVPTDVADDEAKLNAYRSERKPPYRLMTTLSRELREEFTSELTRVLGQEPALPSTIITDSTGHILAAQAGLPDVSAIRQLLKP